MENNKYKKLFEKSRQILLDAGEDLPEETLEQARKLGWMQEKGDNDESGK